MIATILLAAALTAPGSATSTPVQFDGKFNVTYQPIYCSRAPCPAGTYHAVAGNKAVAAFKSFTVNGNEGRGGLKVEGLRSLEGDGVGIDGTLNVQNGVATITARRLVAALWKVEGELPPAPTEGATGAKTITVVNRTGDVIRGIYFTPAHDDQWGPDRTNDNLGMKQKVTLDLPTADCVYDIRIILGGRPSEALKRQDLCKDALVVADRKGVIVERR